MAFKLMEKSIVFNAFDHIKKIQNGGVEADERHR